MLTEGMTLAALIDAMLPAPIRNRDAVKMITRALRSGDFVITPEIVAPSHLTYICDPPNSLHVAAVILRAAKTTF